MTQLENLHAGKSENYAAYSQTPGEVVRVAYQSALLDRNMGRLFPEGVDLSRTSRILDIACGTGAWALDVAESHPHTHVTGIDISKPMLSYAGDLALLKGLSNVSFIAMDALKPLDFPDGTFDWIDIRWFSTFLSFEQWPQLLAECARITRPSGGIRITEFELGLTTSWGCETLNELLLSVFSRTGRSFSSSGRSLSTTAVLGCLLRACGCGDVRDEVHSIDLSLDQQESDAWREDFLAGIRSTKPFLVNVGAVTEGEFDRLFKRATLDTRREDFYGLILYRSSWGKKPT